MSTIGLLLRVMATCLLLLFALAPQCAAAPNHQPVHQDIYFPKNGETALVWNQPSLYISHYGKATLLRRRDLTARAIDFPSSWDAIVAFADDALRVANQILDDVAQEFNVTGQIDDLRITFNDILTTSGEIREHITEVTQQGITLDQISDELGLILNDILIYLQKAFPPPDQAPSHEERQKMVTIVLDKTEQGILDLFRKYGMPEDRLEILRESFDRLKPHIKKFVVITGDLIEQHPVLFSTLMFTGAMLLIPESWILRPLLGVMGFGPYGPIKGSPAAWAQRQFWGAAVQKGSWFAILQSLGMKGASGIRPILSAAGGGIGALFGKIFH